MLRCAFPEIVRNVCSLPSVILLSVTPATRMNFVLFLTKRVIEDSRKEKIESLFYHPRLFFHVAEKLLSSN